MRPGILVLLGSILLASAGRAQQPPVPPQAPVSEEPSISDNSFLIEEAYNQEYGVVQHINGFTRNSSTGEWAYTFTQEWPVNFAPRHQLSYTLQAVKLGGFSGSGIGDLFLNYRYQVLGGAGSRVAFAPRLSLLVPSGDSRRGRGAGSAGVQINLPLSVMARRKLATHWNAGTTLVPHAKNEFGASAASHSYNLGHSFIWLVHPRFNCLLETVYTRTQEVVGAGRTASQDSVTLNPGFRWAHNFRNGLQIVPGIAFPVQVGGAGRGQWGVLLYLSFEHPFKRTREGSR